MPVDLDDRAAAGATTSPAASALERDVVLDRRTGWAMTIVSGPGRRGRPAWTGERKPTGLGGSRASSGRRSWRRSAWSFCAPPIAASRPRSLPGLARDRGDVGGHVAGVVALDEVGGHHAAPARALPIWSCTTPSNGLRGHAVAAGSGERGVEVRALLARALPARASAWQAPHGW